MNILFIGLGGIGQRHLRNLLSICDDSLEIYAYRVQKEQYILDNKLNVSQSGGLEEIYAIKVCESLQEAWQKNIDIVFICNPTSKHKEVLTEAISHNCDIFIEKPIADEIEGLEELVDAANRKGLITLVGYQNRFHPCIKRTKELLIEKKIGKILTVNAEIGEDVRGWHRYEDYRKMYASRKELGGGVVLSQIHELDYLYYFFERQPQIIYALGGKMSDLEIDVEDIAEIMMKFIIEDKDVIVHLHQDYMQNPPSRKCKIIGSEGKIEFDLLESIIKCYDEEGKCIEQQKYVFERNDMFIEELRLFLDAVKTRKQLELRISEGIESLKIALAIKESMKSGKPIIL